MRSRFQWFWCGVLIEGAIACVSASGANAKTLPTTPDLNGLNFQGEMETMKAFSSEEREKKEPAERSIAPSSGIEQKRVGIVHPEPEASDDRATPDLNGLNFQGEMKTIKAFSSDAREKKEPAQRLIAPSSGIEQKHVGIPKRVGIVHPEPEASDNRVLQAQNQPAAPQNQPQLNQPLQPQSDPNRDRFPQPAPIPEPLPEESPSPVLTPPTPAPDAAPSSDTLEVKKVQVTGSTIFGPEQLNSITQTVEGRTVTLEELRNVADAITQLYLNQGYITSRAILVDQAITDGVVQIRVIEGSLEEIRVEGTRRLNPNYVRSRVRLGAGKPLNTGKLEDQLRLLRVDPLFKNVEASLRSGSGVGQSILVVRVTETKPFYGSFGIDNYSPPSVGSERLGANLGYRNVTGIGDEIAASYYHTTTGGADVLDLSYRVPLNAMNGTLQLRYAPNRNEVTQAPFNVFDIRGESQLYEISYRQPLIRSPREEFALSLGFTHQNGQTFTFAGPTPFGFGPDEEGRSRTSVIKFGQDYLRRDVKGAWALRSLFSLGTGLLDATINPDPIPDGRFLSWLGQVQRVQVLNNNNFLIVQGDIQLSTSGLLPSQQFVIGGGQSLRGYRQNVRAGDNGVRLSIEDRITVQRDEAGAATLQFAPFVDLGWVWNASDNPNNATLQDEKFLAGAGLGLIWQPLPKLNIRLDYGIPLVDIEDRGENAQDRGFYFSVNYQL